MRDRKWERKMAKHMSEDWQKSKFRGRIASGIAIIGFGILILLDRSGMNVPDWAVSLGSILSVIGIVVLIEHGFKKIWGWVLLAVGGIFLANEIQPNMVNPKMILPIILIIVGISLMVKAFSNQKKKLDRPFDGLKSSETSNEDYFESSSVFSGVEKIVMSKNFKGAKVSSVFGGHEVNLMQADIEDSAEIHATAIFGGVTLIIPSNWKVTSDISSMFGGVEDNRSLHNHGWENVEKTLYLKGSCAFGGIEIKSYN